MTLKSFEISEIYVNQPKVSVQTSEGVEQVMGCTGDIVQKLFSMSPSSSESSPSSPTSFGIRLIDDTYVGVNAVV